MNLIENTNRIAEVFKNEGKTSYQVLLTIPGKFLIANNIQKEWAELRNLNPSIINYEFEDNITLFQAELLGILDFVKQGKEVIYKQGEEFLGEANDLKQI